MVTRSYPDHEGEKKKKQRNTPKADSNEFEPKTFDVPDSFVHAGSERTDVLCKKFKSD